MRLTQYFLPVLKDTPSDAQIISHQLMIRTGMIHQTSSGIYSWLPLGLKVLNRVETIVREEMNRSGCIELLMPTIQPADLWRESGRYDDYGKEMLRIKDRHERDMLYGPTNEEVITDIVRHTLRSYRDFPKNLYHIQWKFRDEIRPRFGVMRGREFLMKDAYSFDLTPEAAQDSYEKMFQAYFRCFTRMGLKPVPVRAETGPIGGDLSHEFHVLASTGESTIFYDARLDDIDLNDFDVARIRGYYAMEEGMHKPESCSLSPDQLRQAKGIEVGHIFYLGTKYSKMMGAEVMTTEGNEVPVEMGCYGIGVSRLVGAIIEASHDDQGIIWPEEVAPFKIGLLNLKVGDKTCDEACENLYQQAKKMGIDVLYDDRDERAGNKFALMDLIGLPWQVIVSPRGLENNQIEVKCRRTGERTHWPLEKVMRQWE